MARATYSPLQLEILKVLQKTKRGKQVSLGWAIPGPYPHYITAYQILQRLPKRVRTALFTKHQNDKVGKGAGAYVDAATEVANAAGTMKADVECNDYIDIRGMKFFYDGDKGPVIAGNVVARLYRLKRPKAQP